MRKLTRGVIVVVGLCVEAVSAGPVLDTSKCCVLLSEGDQQHGQVVGKYQVPPNGECTRFLGQRHVHRPRHARPPTERSHGHQRRQAGRRRRLLVHLRRRGRCLSGKSGQMAELASLGVTRPCGRDQHDGRWPGGRNTSAVGYYRRSLDQRNDRAPRRTGPWGFNAINDYGEATGTRGSTTSARPSAPRVTSTSPRLYADGPNRIYRAHSVATAMPFR